MAYIITFNRKSLSNIEKSDLTVDIEESKENSGEYLVVILLPKIKIICKEFLFY